MDAFDLLPSLADGELAASSAPELVAAIFRSRASGTLTIEAPELGEVRQFFRAGQMCGSAFFAGFRTLAQVLLEEEWAQALDVDDSLHDAQQQGRRHGEVLLAKGLLTQEQLEEALGAQHRGNLMALMALEEGHYEMRGWEPPPLWTRELNIDPLGPLFDSLQLERLARRRAVILDWLGIHAVRLTPDWADMAQKALIDANDHRAIAQLAHPRTRGEFVAVSRLMPARAEALLTGLLLIGAAEPTVPAAQLTSAISRGPALTSPTRTSGAWSSPPPRTMSPPQGSRAPYAHTRPISPPVLPTAPTRTISQPIQSSPPTRLIPGPTPSVTMPPVLQRVRIFPTGTKPVSDPPPPRRGRRGDELDAENLEPSNPFAASLTQAAPEPLPHLSRTGEPEVDDESVLPEAVLASNPGVDKNRARRTPVAPPEDDIQDAQDLLDEQPLELDLERAFTPSSRERRPSAAPPSRRSEPPRPPPTVFGGHSVEIDEIDLEGASAPGEVNDEEIDLHSSQPVFKSQPVYKSQPAFDSQPVFNSSPPPPAGGGDELRKKLRARGLRNMADASRDVTEEPVLDSSSTEMEMPRMQPQVEEAGLSREAGRFLDDVRARVRMLPSQTPWQRLGVSRKATNEQIHAAYLEAVKRYHPDRASALGLSGAAEDVKTLFAAVKEAHEKIGTAASRERYAAQSTSSPGGNSPRGEEASLALKMGDVLLKKRDFTGALIKLRRACELDPNGDTLAALAWGLLCDPAATPATRSEAEMLIDRSLRVGGATARTHYVAGVSWRARDPSAAEEAFRKAVEVDPNHRAAAQELRLLELRQQRNKGKP